MIKRTYKPYFVYPAIRLLTFFLLTCFSVLISGCLEHSQNDSALKVTYVYDGDTIKLANGEKVRYLGIDTPEMNYKNPPAEYFAKDAKAAE